MLCNYLTNSRGSYPNMFWYLVERDFPIFVTQLIALQAAYILLFFPWRWPSPERIFSKSRPKVLWLAVATLIFSFAGTWLVCLNYPLSLDEYMADIQAHFYLAGKTRAPVPDEWLPWVYSITPGFVIYLPTEKVWVGPYLPFASMLRAPFLAIGAETLCSPLMLAAGVLFAAALARRLWPEKADEAGLMAAIMLVFSAQAQITAMTPYSMTAQLLFALAWLYCFTLPGWRQWILPPVIGGLAIGLNQPTVHACFVLPFLVRLVLCRRWGMTLVYGAIYLAACLVWKDWYYLSRPAEVSDAGKTVASIFEVPDILNVLLMWMSLGRFAAWHLIALIPLALLGGYAAWRRGYFHLDRPASAPAGATFTTPQILQDLTAGILVTILLYLTFKYSQGHGWGYRYLHGVLANFVLLAAAGWLMLREKLEWNAAASWFSVSLVAMAGIMPFYCWLTYSVTAPFARAQALINSQQADMVVVPDDVIWYGGDLIRNNPVALQKPVLVSRFRLPQAAEDQLRGKPGVVFMDEKTMAAQGLLMRPTQRKKLTPVPATNAPPATN
ncbi:hypothetical protein DB346_01815 [Verrucomicrobia bacterium LW23]|nr:hypothetical protein DB346_01815 [Verrucomicrobia bacterium LW23]